jgi:hypothetical protein
MPGNEVVGHIGAQRGIGLTCLKDSRTTSQTFNPACCLIGMPDFRLDAQVRHRAKTQANIMITHGQFSFSLKKGTAIWYDRSTARPILSRAPADCGLGASTSTRWIL